MEDKKNQTCLVMLGLIILLFGIKLSNIYGDGLIVISIAIQLYVIKSNLTKPN